MTPLALHPAQTGDQSAISVFMSQRWAERLVPFDPDDEYARTKLPTRGVRRHIGAACPAHGEYATRQFKGIYYLALPNAVWVMAAPETVVTVWPMPDNLRYKKRSFEKRRKRLLAAWRERSGISYQNDPIK